MTDPRCIGAPVTATTGHRRWVRPRYVMWVAVLVLALGVPIALVQARQIREQGDAVAAAPFAGELRFGDPATIFVHAAGVVTWIPRVGQTVDLGGTLVRVDDVPTVLVPGGTPAWRDIDRSMPDGPDVEQLESFLAVAGFAAGLDLTVDEKFTDTTARAVRSWQESLGISPTGRVALGQVAFWPAGVRIHGVGSVLGEMTSAASLQVTNVDPRVFVTGLPNAVPSVTGGDSALVELPEGTSIRGSVVSVTPSVSDDGAAQVLIEVELLEPPVAETQYPQPVVVRFEEDS